MTTTAHNDTLAVLCTELAAYCKAQGLPHKSADEYAPEELTPEQRAWMADFSQRWEEAERAEAGPSWWGMR